MVGERLGDEDVVELLHQDPLAVEAFQIAHGERPQVVGSEPVKRHQQQRRRASPARAVPRKRSGCQESHQQPNTSQEPEQHF